MNSFHIEPMADSERLYAYSNSQQIEGQTGCIGYLRGDFGDGNEFYTSWFVRQKRLNDEQFRADLDEVVNYLRADDGPALLYDRRHMLKYCCNYPAAIMKGTSSIEYGFTIRTGQYTYCLRCNPTPGNYNFYLYAYVAEFLDSHIKKAARGIRFITPNYTELFRLPDGGKIRIFDSNGEFDDLSCRYIDETHFELGTGTDNLFHICQFAELMESLGHRYSPVLDT